MLCSVASHEIGDASDSCEKKKKKNPQASFMCNRLANPRAAETGATPFLRPRRGTPNGPFASLNRKMYISYGVSLHRLRDCDSDDGGCESLACAVLRHVEPREKTTASKEHSW